MPNDRDQAEQFARVLRPTPTPPPPMPSAVPVPPPPPPVADAGKVTTQAVPAAAQPKGWEVDSDQLSAFTHAVQSVRDRLRDVQAKVDRMQTESYTPRLGTSPVGVQLEEKFADRLDAPLDDPTFPMAGGLRPMLAVAMRRMDEFVAGAETAVKAYQEQDDSSAARISTPKT